MCPTKRPRNTDMPHARPFRWLRLCAALLALLVFAPAPLPAVRITMDDLSL